jgi:hypothetical protein
MEISGPSSDKLRVEAKGAAHRPRTRSERAKKTGEISRGAVATVCAGTGRRRGPTNFALRNFPLLVPSRRTHDNYFRRQASLRFLREAFQKDEEKDA